MDLHIALIGAGIAVLAEFLVNLLTKLTGLNWAEDVIAIVVALIYLVAIIPRLKSKDGTH